tara:strand:- start:240 stop:923 length:684 start_codon:yes stop_codon:yes gene_type:complete
MNIRILNELERVLQISPQVLKNEMKLRQLIQATFNVRVDDVSFKSIGDLVDRIDFAVLSKYFGEVWQPKTKQFKYSGLKLIDEINSLNPTSVLDLGCGYNEFKGKIPHLVGVDPYNKNADIQQTILEYNPGKQFDVIIVLGSINFGSTDKVFAELEHAVELCAPGGTMFFRVNSGVLHEAPESDWIVFYPWNANFIQNCADHFGVDILDLRNDSNNRMYFVWRKKQN